VQRCWEYESQDHASSLADTCSESYKRKNKLMLLLSEKHVKIFCDILCAVLASVFPLSCMRSGSRRSQWPFGTKWGIAAMRGEAKPMILISNQDLLFLLPMSPPALSETKM